MTPQLVFDLATLIGFGVVICAQHLAICDLRKKLAVERLLTNSGFARLPSISHIEALEREIAKLQTREYIEEPPLAAFGVVPFP